MSHYYLLGDFGSTYSKFCLIQESPLKIIAKDTRPTTSNTSIVSCYQAAKTALLNTIHFDPEVDVLEENFASSAWGGYKMVVVGFTASLSQEAAKRAALGAGTKILKTYSYHLSLEDIQEIQQLNPDVILLTGGSDGGNKNFVIECGNLIAENMNHMDVIYAGNKEAVSEVESIFEKTENHLFVTRNVMPIVDELDVEPVREVARDIFIDKILHTNGLNDIAMNATLPIIPTPSAVLNSTQLLAKYLEADVMVVDVGGATTDIHSYSSNRIQRNDFVYEGLQEPLLKRTVEGDLGMRLSADSVRHQKEFQTLFEMDYQDLPENRLDTIIQHYGENYDYLACNQDEKVLDQILAMTCVNIASKRHVGHLRKVSTPNCPTYYQRGKNLQSVQYVIGTGGIIVHNQTANRLLEQSLSTNELDLRPQQPKLLIDVDYLLSLIGIFSQNHPNQAFDLLKDHLNLV